MTKERWLYSILALLFVVYIAVEHYAPEPLQWIPTYAPKDQQPYGGFILYDRLEDFFPDGKEQTFKTLYEYDSARQVLIICTQFKPSKQDVGSLLEFLDEGYDVLVASAAFGDHFLDTLGLEDHPRFNPDQYLPGDSIELNVSKASVYYPSAMITNYFELDTAGWQVLAEIQNGPVVITRLVGDGRLTLSAFPLAFSNYALLKTDGLKLPELALNQMEAGTIDYNRYYQVGRMESSSPFRFFMANPALRWAVYLTLLGVLLVLLVNSRRKQRAIPVFSPPANTTVQFVKTMGGLYHREGNHQKAAEKMIHHFVKNINDRFFIRDLFNEVAYQKLAHRTGVKLEEVIKTFETIQYIKNGGSVSEQLLADLNERITRFNLK